MHHDALAGRRTGPVPPLTHGEALATTLPNATLRIVEGMGHVVPWGHWDAIVAPLLDHLATAQ